MAEAGFSGAKKCSMVRVQKFVMKMAIAILSNVMIVATILMIMMALPIGSLVVRFGIAFIGF